MCGNRQLKNVTGARRMDKVDEVILAVLKNDARISLSELSRQVHKSRTAVESRIQKMVEKGVILGFTIDVAEEDCDNLQSAFLMLRLKGNKCHLVYPQIQGFTEICHVYSLFGDLDMLLEVKCKDFEAIMALKEKILLIEQVNEVKVNPVLKAWR